MDSGIPQHVVEDLSCGTCGYNLRTLPWGGVCPECARPVSESKLAAFAPFDARSATAARACLSIFVLSMLVSIVGYYLLYFAMRYSFPYMRGTARPLFVLMMRVSFGAEILSGFLCSAHVLALTWRRSLFTASSRLILTAATLSLLSAMLRVGAMVHARAVGLPFYGAPTWNSAGLLLHVYDILSYSGLAISLIWLQASARRGQRLVRALLFIAAMASSVLAIAAGIDWLGYFDLMANWDPWIRGSLLNSEWLRRHISVPCKILILLAILPLLGSMRRSMRMSAR